MRASDDCGRIEKIERFACHSTRTLKASMIGLGLGISQKTRENRFVTWTQLNSTKIEKDEMGDGGRRGCGRGTCGMCDGKTCGDAMFDEDLGE